MTKTKNESKHLFSYNTFICLHCRTKIGSITCHRDGLHVCIILVPLCSCLLFT